MSGKDSAWRGWSRGEVSGQRSSGLAFWVNLWRVSAQPLKTAAALRRGMVDGWVDSARASLSDAAEGRATSALRDREFTLCVGRKWGARRIIITVADPAR